MQIRLYLLTFSLILTFSKITFSSNQSSNVSASISEKNYSLVKSYGYDKFGNSYNSNGLVGENIIFQNGIFQSFSQSKQFKYSPGNLGFVLGNYSDYDVKSRISKDFLTTPFSFNDFVFDPEPYSINNGVLDQSNSNKIGWYYSDNNTTDQKQDASSNPFALYSYNDEISENSPFKTIAPGDFFANNDIYSYSIIVNANNELEDYLNFISQNSSISGLINYDLNNYFEGCQKVISKNSEGRFNFTYQDLNGNVIIQSEFGATKKYANTEFGVPMYFVNVPIDHSVTNFNDYVVNLVPEFTELNTPYEIIEIDNNGGLLTNSAVNGNGSTNTYAYSIDKDYLVNHPDLKFIQIRSLLPFELTAFHNYFVFGSSSGNRQAGPDDPWTFPIVLHDYEVFYSKNNDPKSSVKLFLWNTADCDLTFQNPFDINVYDIANNNTNVFNGSNSNFNPSVHLNNAGVYKIERVFANSLLTINWNNLDINVYPYSENYENDESTLTYPYKQNALSYNFYDVMGNLRYAATPNSIISQNSSELIEYRYETNGKINYKNYPDEGYTEYVFSRDGRIKFTQNSLQRINGHFDYFHYDRRGLILESGEFRPEVEGSDDETRSFENFTNQKSGTFSSNSVLNILNQNGTSGTSDAYSFDVKRYLYDIEEENNPSGVSQSNLSNNLSYSSYSLNGEDARPTSENWYNYDIYGKLLSDVHRMFQWNYNEYSLKEYDYDLTGTILKTFYTSPYGNSFDHSYSYNADRELKLVQTKYNTNDWVENAEYQYNHIGQLERMELAGDQQGIDFYYGINGGLISVNNPFTGKDSKDTYNDILSLFYEMHDGDYSKNPTTSELQSVDEYIVNSSTLIRPDYTVRKLKSFGWKFTSPNEISNLSDDFQMYIYDYDPKSQLLESTYGTVQEALENEYQYVSNSNDFKEIIDYDDNGNITSLDRYTSNNTLYDDFSLNYNTSGKSNRLNNLSDGNQNLERSYAYNQLGNVDFIVLENNLTEKYPYKHIKFQYYSNKQVKRIELYVESEFEKTVEDVKIEYFYNENKKCILKKYYGIDDSQNLSWIEVADLYYDYDANGKLIATYMDQAPEGASEMIARFFMYGLSRLGYFDPNLVNESSIYSSQELNVNGEYVYDLRDHQENTRALFMPCLEGPQILNHNNYYALGSMFNNSVQINYEFNYQGLYSRFELLSGLNEFDARMYDPSLGRWLAVDPAHQFASAYNGMGNVPHYVIDPDGEIVPLLAIAIGAAIGGTINLGIQAAKGNIGSFQDGLVAFGIGAVAGGVGAFTGGAAFLAAGGGVAGAGGLIAGAAGGAFGTAFAAPIQNFGNHLYFKEDLMSAQDMALSIAYGAAFGGLLNGAAAGFNGRNVITGKELLGAPLRNTNIPTLAPKKAAEVSVNAKRPEVRDPGLGTPKTSAQGNKISTDGIKLRGDFVGKNIETIQFGKDPNQVYHAFRHVKAAGLDPAVVKSAVTSDFFKYSNLKSGVPYNFSINVQGKQVIYTAFKLDNGIVNIGRIVVP
ncbi:MAG: RHS repeat-associated core domain-containing protein [Cytophagales bacterium]